MSVSAESLAAAPADRRLLRAGPRWRRVSREPLLHFLLLGALLFAVSEYLEDRARFREIRITRAMVDGVQTHYRLQYGTDPTPAQLDALVEAQVREQVYYHEALKLGLDRDDEIIRRRLVQKFEFLQQDLAVVDEPTQDKLRAWFDTHRHDYSTPPRFTFTHVYFSPDGRGDEAARVLAARAAGELAAAAVERAPEFGDRFPGPVDFAAVSAEEAARAFGATGLAAELPGLPLGRWIGPVRSGLGWHVVRIEARQEPRQPALEDVQAVVRRDYLDHIRGLRNDATYQRLRARFDIVREQ